MSSQIVQSVAVAPATAWAILNRGHDFESPNENYWYAVFVGRMPGVHPKGHDISANLLDIPGANVIRCHTEEEANAEFAMAIQNGLAARVELTQTSRYLNVTALDLLPMAIVPDNVTPSRRWYSVTVGRFPSVFNGPSGLLANTGGISGAAATKFRTRVDAIQHFTNALNAGLVIESTKKSSRTKPPVGADGLNKYQRYYRKRKSLAQNKLGKEETIGGDSDEIKPSNSQGLGDNDDSSTDSVAQPPHQPPRLFYVEPEKMGINREDDDEASSADHQSSRNAPCLTPSVNTFFSPPELSVSHDHFNVDWRPSAHALHSPLETLPSHNPFSSDWRPPTQIIPSADNPSVVNRSIQDSFRDFGLYLGMRDAIASWSRYWSGMDNWPQALNESFERHKGYGPEGVSTFLRKLWLHEQRGRQLLHRIQSRLTGAALPSNPQALMALWNLQQEQVMVLTRGLTIMELTGSLALHDIHSIGAGRVIDAIPSALSAPNTPLFPPKRQTEQEEDDVESYLKGSS